MKSPIFVLDGSGHITAFGSEREACSWVESMDVESGEYPGAYDAEGRRLTLRVVEPTGRRRFLGLEWVRPGRVVLEALEDLPSHGEELRGILLSALRNAGRIAASDITVEEAVQIAARAFGRAPGSR
jgi:hypothetical protein